MSTAMGAALQQLIVAYEALTPATVAALADRYAPDAHFSDPFNDVTGRDTIAQIFTAMFVQVDAPRFAVVESYLDGQRALLVWDFSFVLRGAPQTIRGVSRLVFEMDGRVADHVDYWDPAAGLYEKLPVLGVLLRWLRRRIAAHG